MLKNSFLKAQRIVFCSISSFSPRWRKSGQRHAGKVMTVIYMDKNMILQEPENQVNDWNTWCPETTIGEVINSPIKPILWAE